MFFTPSVSFPRRSCSTATRSFWRKEENVMDTTTTTEELVRTVGDIPERMGAGVCFGSPIERDGRTLIPVARVSFGYGLGFGRGVGTGHGDHGQGEGAGEGEGGGG